MQEIIRKDKNGTVLEIGDEVQVELTSGGGTGVVTSCKYDPCDWDNSSKVWINWKTGHGDGSKNIGFTCWSDFQKVTLIKRKTKAHVHAELIKAWADDPNLEIQKSANNIYWTEKTLADPWDEHWYYRLKPKTRKVKKYNFSYNQKNGDIQTSYCKFTEEDFKKQFVDKGCCTEYVRLDFSMQEVEIEV